ncbi:hypothetical protein ACJMK2_018127 [Sinanodonta woodiana]|uniref:Neurotransmitter-gated ion-channel ligand-binding domain-containing protein n=1 Tax=Sinanodonta woodiana TaxID=1069815 RepID=A0ABD3UCS7_SINWO
MLTTCTDSDNSVIVLCLPHVLILTTRNAIHIATVKICGITPETTLNFLQSIKFCALWFNDTKERILETRSIVWMAWKDERLSWDPSKYNQVNLLHIPTDSIWIPDIVLYNNDGDAEKPMSDMIADVTSDGSVIYAPELHLKSLCETGREASEAARIARILRFSEIVYATELKLVTLTSQTDLSFFRRVSTDEFTVKSTSMEVYHTTFNCCPNEENKKKFPIQFATFTIIISNKPNYR